MLEVKGLGTHAQADITSPKVTGLLCFADALRELCFHRLLQRIIDIDACNRAHEEDLDLDRSQHRRHAKHNPRGGHMRSGSNLHLLHSAIR